MDEDTSEDKAALELSTASTSKKNEKPTPQRRKGILSRIWHAIFSRHSDDFEKRLEYLSKEEASVHSRMKRRAQTWRSISRNLIIYSVILEVAAVIYAIMTTRSFDLDWKMRAVRVIPVFAVSIFAAAIYSTLSSYNKMRDRSDQKTLERLRAERQAKINELKEKTNYYITQQLIQRYDTDPAAKAAAASVLASKLGADSGLKVIVGDEPKLDLTHAKSSDSEVVQSTGLRNRKSSFVRSNSRGSTKFQGNTKSQETLQEIPNAAGVGGHQFGPHNQTVAVAHRQRSTANEGGWIARVAAMLVGEDPTQCYALICGNCHMHNGLARKEDFPYITYYCPRCNALNSSSRQESPTSASSSQVISPRHSIDSHTTAVNAVPESNTELDSASLSEEVQVNDVKPSDAPAS